MIVEWVIASRYVEVHDSTATIVGAGIDTLFVPQVPVSVQINLAVRLQGLPEEMGATPHNVRNVVRGPDDEIAFDLSAEVAFNVQQTIPRPDLLQGVILPMVVQFEATVEGTYTNEHVVGSSSYKMPIHIIVASGGPPQAPPT